MSPYPPFPPGLPTPLETQEALSWGGALDEELRRAATTLNLSEIVQRYHVTGFNLGDPPRATRLLRLSNPPGKLLGVRVGVSVNGFRSD